MAAVTITTFGDLLTDFAEKIGQTSQNTDDDRKRRINNAYYFVANKRLWWWLETSGTDTTTTATDYALPSDFRAFHPKNPVKISSNWRVMVSFDDFQRFSGTQAVVQLPTVEKKKRAYIYSGRIYFIQDTMTAGSTITYYYYKDITALDTTSDTPLMPVEFREMISLYAAGMYLKSQGGAESVEANDYLELFDVYMADMQRDDDRRRGWGIKRRALDPSEAAVRAS